MLWLSRFTLASFCALIVLHSAPSASAQLGISVHDLLGPLAECVAWDGCRHGILCDADADCDPSAELCVPAPELGEVLRCCGADTAECGELGPCVSLGEGQPSVCLDANRYCLGRGSGATNVRTCHTSPDGTMTVRWEDGDCNRDGRTNRSAEDGAHCRPPRELDDEGSCKELELRCAVDGDCPAERPNCQSGWCRSNRTATIFPARCCSNAAECRAGEECIALPETGIEGVCVTERGCEWNEELVVDCAMSNPADVVDVLDCECPPVEDAGVDMDAGAPLPDAGSEADAGAEIDAGPEADAGLGMDAGGIDASRPPPEGSITGGGGCRCRAGSGGGGAGGVALLVMGALLFVRRRR